MSVLATSIKRVATEVKGIRSKKKKDKSTGATEETKIRLSKMPPAPGQSALPSAKAWRHWCLVKLVSWCAALCAGFEEYVTMVIDKKIIPLLPSKFAKANRVLSLERAQMLDEKQGNIAGKDTSNGLLTLHTRNYHVMQTSAERTAGLHKRLEKPSPCPKRGQLALYLAAWKSHLEELAEAGSKPSRDTALSSLKSLVKNIRGLHVVMETTELAKPGQVAAHYKILLKKATEWAAFDAGPRLRDGKGGDHKGKGADGKGKGGDGKGKTSGHIAKSKAQPTKPNTSGGYYSQQQQQQGQKPYCKFFNAPGHCSRGNKCKFIHTPKGKRGDGKEDGKGKSKLDKNQCRKCGEFGHGGNECPNAKGALVATPGDGTLPVVIGTAIPQQQPVQAQPVTLEQLKTVAAAYAKRKKDANTGDELKSILKPVGLIVRGATVGVTEAEAVVEEVPTRFIVMAGDSGAESHVISKSDEAHIVERRPCHPVVLETANGITIIEEEVTAICGWVPVKHCLFGAESVTSLASIDTLADDGWAEAGEGATLLLGVIPLPLTKAGGLHLTIDRNPDDSLPEPEDQPCSGRCCPNKYVTECGWDGCPLACCEEHIPWDDDRCRWT